MLVLFDIDGTLIDTSGAGRRSIAAALRDVAGIPDAMAGVSLHGATDPNLVIAALKAAGQEPTHQRVGEVLARYLVCLEAELKRCQDDYRVLPGAHELLSALTATGRHVIGLATGNLAEGARLKLSQGELWGYFGFGGFGSDAGDRAELTRIGISRGRAEARVKLEQELPPARCFVVGDTEHDIRAARAADARAVGVLEGSGVQDALRASHPDLLVRSLNSPALWEALELQRPD